MNWVGEEIRCLPVWLVSGAPQSLSLLDLNWLVRMFRVEGAIVLERNVEHSWLEASIKMWVGGNCKDISIVIQYVEVCLAWLMNHRVVIAKLDVLVNTLSIVAVCMTTKNA